MAVPVVNGVLQDVGVLDDVARAVGALHDHGTGLQLRAREFTEQVLQPFGARFDPAEPFRPVTVRGAFADGDTVIVLWDGEGRTTAGTTYRNTYAWFMRLRDGKVVDGTAFYDSISFDELWESVRPT